VKPQWFIKRVPVDFDWPLGQIWHGYVNPWPGPIPCPECMGDGFNPETRKLHATFRSWAPNLTKEEQQKLLEKGPTLKEIKRLKRRIEGSDTPLIRLLLVEIRAKRKGLWGACSKCGGDQQIQNPNPAVSLLYEGVHLHNEWKPVEPPTGEGWQLWENQAPEGRPVSPVFGSPPELAFWCAHAFDTEFAEEDWFEWIVKAQPRPEERLPFRLQSESFKVFVPPKTTKPH